MKGLTRPNTNAAIPGRQFADEIAQGSGGRIVEGRAACLTVLMNRYCRAAASLSWNSTC
jgi:hypothetical protein